MTERFSRLFHRKCLQYFLKSVVAGLILIGIIFRDGFPDQEIGTGTGNEGCGLGFGSSNSSVSGPWHQVSDYER